MITQFEVKNINTTIIAAVCQEWTRELLVKLKKGSKMIVPQKTVVYKGFMLN